MSPIAGERPSRRIGPYGVARDGLVCPRRLFGRFFWICQGWELGRSSWLVRSFRPRLGFALIGRVEASRSSAASRGIAEARDLTETREIRLFRGRAKTGRPLWIAVERRRKERGIRIIGLRRSRLAARFPTRKGERERERCHMRARSPQRTRTGRHFRIPGSRPRRPHNPRPSSYKINGLHRLPTSRPRHRPRPRRALVNKGRMLMVNSGLTVARQCPNRCRLGSGRVAPSTVLNSTTRKKELLCRSH
jgi:hypothetical protein